MFVGMTEAQVDRWIALAALGIAVLTLVLLGIVVRRGGGLPVRGVPNAEPVPVKVVPPAVVEAAEPLPVRFVKERAVAEQQGPALPTVDQRILDEARRSREMLEQALETNGLASAVEAELAHPRRDASRRGATKTIRKPRKRH